MRQLLPASTLGLIASMVCTAAPALAGSVVVVPEPTSMALIASAAAGAAVAYRFIRRK